MIRTLAPTLLATALLAGVINAAPRHPIRIVASGSCRYLGECSEYDYYALECGHDRSGGNSTSAAVGSYQQCFSMCDAMTDCKGFAFTGGAGAGTCYFKSNITDVEPSPYVDFARKKTENMPHSKSHSQSYTTGVVAANTHGHSTHKSVTVEPTSHATSTAPTQWEGAHSTSAASKKHAMTTEASSPSTTSAKCTSSSSQEHANMSTMSSSSSHKHAAMTTVHTAPSHKHSIMTNSPSSVVQTHSTTITAPSASNSGVKMAHHSTAHNSTETDPKSPQSQSNQALGDLARGDYCPDLRDEATFYLRTAASGKKGLDGGAGILHVCKDRRDAVVAYHDRPTNTVVVPRGHCDFSGIKMLHNDGVDPLGVALFEYNDATTGMTRLANGTVSWDNPAFNSWAVCGKKGLAKLVYGHRKELRYWSAYPGEKLRKGCKKVDLVTQCL